MPIHVPIHSPKKRHPWLSIHSSIAMLCLLRGFRKRHPMGNCVIMIVKRPRFTIKESHIHIASVVKHKIPSRCWRLSVFDAYPLTHCYTSLVFCWVAIIARTYFFFVVKRVLCALVTVVSIHSCRIYFQIQAMLALFR